MNNQLTLFDYATLDPETRIVVQQRTSELHDKENEFRNSVRRTVQIAWSMGEKFFEVQQRLARFGHGTFTAWLDIEFPQSSRLAYHFINIHRHFVLETVSETGIGLKALYLLSAPSTPELARVEAIERASAGEVITHSTVKDIVEAHKPQSEPIAPATLPIDYSQVDTETGEFLQDDEPLENASQGRQKPKVNRAGDKYVPQGHDACQTPAYAIDPLLPYLDNRWIVWEPACGEGLIVEALYDSGFKNVYASDLITGENFFDHLPPAPFDCIVTNPPYSIKYDWIKRCYELGKPFALLLPVETLGAKTAQVFFRSCGLEVIFLDQRVNFKMPNIGWEGSSAQFPVAWFTYGLDIGQQMVFAEIKRND